MEVLTTVDEACLRTLLAAGTYVWIDLAEPDAEALAALGRALSIHPLALEDSGEFGQRPKVDRYEDSALIVYYGARSGSSGAATAVEFHLHVAPGSLVTVHAGHSPVLEDVRRHAASDDPPVPEDGVVYRVLDAITDTLAPALERQHDELERLREAILRDPQRSLLGRADGVRAHIDRMQRRLGGQKERFDDVVDVVMSLPGTTAGADVYLHDVHDHLVDALGDLAGQGAAVDRLMDFYFNASTERIELVSSRLTLITALLVPLTLVTGFFGMNFRWMTDHVESAAEFLVFGVGGTLAALVVTVIILRLAARG